MKNNLTLRIALGVFIGMWCFAITAGICARLYIEHKVNQISNELENIWDEPEDEEPVPLKEATPEEKRESRLKGERFTDCMSDPHTTREDCEKILD